jgi:branched-chain amino acid transport system permease protein
MSLGIELILTQLLNALCMGLIFALIAVGLSIIMGLLGIVNMAHGVFYLFGAYFTVAAVSWYPNFGLGVIIAALLCSGIALAVFFLFIRYLMGRRRPLEIMVALIGINIICEELIRNIFGAEPKYLAIPSMLSGQVTFNFLGVTLMYPKYYLSLIIICGSLLILIYYFFHKTDLGIRGLALIQDRETALALGVNIAKLGTLFFAIGGAVAGISGALAGPIFSVYPTMGIELLGFIFVIVIIGGVGSIEGTFLASLLISTIKSVGVLFASNVVVDAFIYVLLCVMLCIRPRGLKGYLGVLE